MSVTIPTDAHAIIIGAMKCGTSSVYDYLCGHPEICPCRTKEPEFFSENEKHGTKVANYEDLFSFDRSKHKYTLEASTGYTKYPREPNVPGNTYEYGILPKFIYLIRNPFDRIQSHYNFMQWDDHWTLDIIDHHQINTSNYFLQLERYKPYFPMNRVLILDFDDLKNDPSGILKTIYDFLGLSHSYFPAHYEVANRSPMSGIEKKMKNIKIDRLCSHLPASFRHTLRVALGKIFPAKQRELTKAEREYIFNQLYQSMQKLHTVFGIDTQKWGF
jgi:hypothetical protein